MKTTNILLGPSPDCLEASMLFSAIQDIMVVPEAVEFVSTKLGYPKYLIAFSGCCESAGCNCLVVLGFPRITEWAYAGFFFDLTGATYSNICVEGLKPDMAFMLLPFTIGGLSYLYHHKRLNSAAG